MPVPRPSPVFVVGVSGHRTGRLDRVGGDPRAAIGQHLAAIFAAVAEAVRREAAAQAAWYSGEPARCRLVSSLADGVDAIAARALPPDWELTAILPLPPDVYRERLLSDQPGDVAAAVGAEHDWARDHRAEIVLSLPLVEDEDESTAYARAADLMLRQCDLLVAVWDGEFDGKAGGTGDVVTRALGWNIPVVLIEASGRPPPRLVSTMQDVRQRHSRASALSGPLAEAVASALAIPERSETGEVRHAGRRAVAAADKLVGYLGETPPKRSFATAYRLLLLVRQPQRWRPVIPIAGEAELRRDWSRFLECMPDQDGFAKRLDQVLLPRVAAADALATSYGHAYRSAYVSAYALSIGAVLVALVSLSMHGSTAEDVFLHERWLVSLELVFVLLILFIIGRGHARRFHDRWLDTRALAETLRCLRIVGPVGCFEPVALGSETALPGAGWQLWYLRATMRELGLPAGKLDADAQWRTLTAASDAEIERQITYHEENATRLAELDHVLHAIGTACFVATAAILTLLLVVLGVEAVAPLDGLMTDFAGRMAPWFPVAAFLTTLLPAVGATVSGIRFTGDFEGFAARSITTATELRQLRAEHANAVTDLSIDATCRVLVKTARILSIDLQGWRTLYDRKRLVLPG